MPNNFKITVGNIYVSKAGNDSNSGLTPDAPKLTVQAGLDAMVGISSSTLVIGAGVYSENISRGFPNNLSNYSIVGDGEVVLDGLSNLSITFTNTGTVNAFMTLNIFGIKFRNFSNVIFRSGNDRTPMAFNVYNCSFFNSVVNPTATTDTTTYSNAFNFYNCFFVNSTISSFASTLNRSTPITFDKCNFVNSSFIRARTSVLAGSINQFLNSYTDSKSLITLQGGLGAQINFNNLQGKIIVEANGAVSGVNSFGVAQDFTQHRIDYPAYNVNSISQDPLFNDPRVLNFTVKSGSPNFSASYDFSSNIGNLEYAVYYSASSAEFTTNATSESLEFKDIYYSISGSSLTGSITSGPMFIQWPITRPLTCIQWAGNLEFNKTISASLRGNNNVPAYATYTSASGEAGANPDRLKIQIRFSTQQNQPTTDSEWDNRGYWSPGTYQMFEINSKPTVDYKGIGNGDPAYAGNSGIGDISPSWVQTRIILRNDYLF